MNGIDRTPSAPRYVITYYGTGITPMHKYLNDREEAIAEFEKMAADPHTGVGSLELEQTIMQLK